MSDYLQQMQAMFNPFNVDVLIKGLEATLWIAVLTILISFTLGAIFGIISASKNKMLKFIVDVYVDFFRNIPVLLLIMSVRFFVPLPWLWPAIGGLSIYTTAIITEVVRAGIKSIPHTQTEAARSQGFKTWQVMRYIILPQALRNVLPPLVSQSVTVIKDTSFAAGISILPMELTGASKNILGMYGQPAQVVTMYALVAAVYFIVNFTISFFARKIRQPGEKAVVKRRRKLRKAEQVSGGNIDLIALEEKHDEYDYSKFYTGAIEINPKEDLKSEEDMSDETTPDSLDS